MTFDEPVARRLVAGTRRVLPVAFGPMKAQASEQRCVILARLPGRRTAIGTAVVRFDLPCVTETDLWGWNFSDPEPFPGEPDYPDGLATIEICPGWLLAHQTCQIEG